MTKTENKLIAQFVGKLSNKEFADANNLLEKVVTEKLKNRVREAVQKNNAEQNK